MLLSGTDNLIILLFAIFIVYIGYHFSRAVKDMESFYLGNRSLPWSLTVGALVATWYGGVGTIGTVEYAAMYGLSIWAIWCVTAHIGRMPLALWVGPRYTCEDRCYCARLIRWCIWQRSCSCGCVFNANILYTILTNNSNGGNWYSMGD